MTHRIFGEATALTPHRGIEKGSIEDLMFLHEAGTAGRISENIYPPFVLVDAILVVQFYTKLQEALDEIRQLRAELSQRPLATTIFIHDLGNDNLKVKSPISVVVHETEEVAQYLPGG